MKRYYLGLASHFTRKECLRHTFAIGREKDRRNLNLFLEQKYSGKVILTKNGRSALAMALMEYFKPGDGILINGFTCYAVYEAIKAAKLVPIFVDISRKNLNFTIETLTNALQTNSTTPSVAHIDEKKTRTTSPIYTIPRGILVQNTLGNPINMMELEKFSKKYDLTIIEDLAHCTGAKYPDGREVGTVGAATVLSFGKDKSIDTTSGGAVVFRKEAFIESEGPQDSSKRASSSIINNSHKAERSLKISKNLPQKSPRLSDTLRARFYPLFGMTTRGLNRVHLGGAFMRLLLKLHWVEKSADNKLDLNRKIAKFEAKLALKQFKKLKSDGEPPIREFYLVHERDKVMDELKRAGYYFDGFWYEKPVSPERYYKKVHFPEKSCPVAVDVSQKIINFPTHYREKDLEVANNIMHKFLEEAE